MGIDTTIKAAVAACSKTFSNGVVVINTTPHSLTFLSPEGQVTEAPTSVKEGERTGVLVLNARAVVTPVGNHDVRTIFLGTADGEELVTAIEAAAEELFPASCSIKIVGSLVAAQAYAGRVRGMVAAPGFERAKPGEKRMSVDSFNVY